MQILIFRIFIGKKRIATELGRPNELPEFGLEFGGLAARGNQLFAVSLAAT
jgi:hypothetical protein